MSVDDLAYYSRHQPVRLRQQFYFLSLYISRDYTSYASFIATLLKFNVQTKYRESFQSTDSDSVYLGWSPSLCISNKLPGEADTSNTQTTPSSKALTHTSIQRVNIKAIYQSLEEFYFLLTGNTPVSLEP